MKKIPTLFVRNPEDRRYVLPQVTPGCEWVLAGEGTATRKYDGTCVMFDGEKWWARREVKPGKEPPAGWQAVDDEVVTMKRVGWQPAERSSFARLIADSAAEGVGWLPGTYELIGPKVNGNPEQKTRHLLVPHGRALLAAPRTFDALREAFTSTGEFPDHWEGIVWHQPDGRMAKIKRRDFPR